MTMDRNSDGSPSEEDIPPTSERMLHEMPSGDSFQSDQQLEYDRDFVVCLLNIGQMLQDRETLINMVTPAQAEALTAWPMLAPNPDFLPCNPAPLPNNPVKRKPVKISEEQQGHLREIQSKAANQMKEVVDSVYRYVPNNGRYRAAKAAAVQSHSSAVMNWKRMRPLDKYMSPEQRVLQREVQRAMKRDLDQKAEIEKEKSEVPAAACPKREQKDNETLRLVEPNIRLSTSADGPKYFCGRTSTEMQKEEAKRPMVHTKMHGVNELRTSETPNPVRPTNHDSTLSKRMSVLDEEMKKDVHVFRRNNLTVDEMMMTRSKSEPSRLVVHETLQRVADEINCGTVSDIKRGTETSKVTHRDYDDMVTEQGASSNVRIQSRHSSHSILDKDDLGGTDSPRRNALFYKVNSAPSERGASGTASAPSRNGLYERAVPPTSSGSATKLYNEQRRATSFDQNMMQKAKNHRDSRLSGKAQEQYIRNVSTGLKTKASSGGGVPVRKVKPKESSGKTVASELRVPIAKIATDSFGGTSRHVKAPEPDLIDASSALLPGVAGKRLNVSAGNHRVL